MVDLPLSIVIPVLNEAENVGPLVAELRSALAGTDYEVMFVDDGSTDGTFDRLRELHAADGRVRAARLNRHYGKTAALMAGFRLSRGGVVVTMDGDLQDVPAEVPRMVAALDDGYDLICAWRAQRQDSPSKRLQSVLFNWALRRFAGADLHDINCGLKAYRRSVVDHLCLTRDQHRYIPLLVAWQGYRVGEIAVTHRSRLHGRSKYGPGRVAIGLLSFARLILTPRVIVVKSPRLTLENCVKDIVGELLD
ncbi:MAG: glycosyltransferase family 2 protein [Chloroflexi bacterium]|nr:glycosyltransferase family 2 protein [Chloroflexota bacterium]MCL5026439.1 glycosyltransferase family 2 protein [Chloroflexota bacterium]